MVQTKCKRSENAHRTRIMNMLSSAHHCNKRYATAMLCLTVLFVFADQNLLSPNLSMIAKEFGFSDSQRDDYLGGNIALGFFLIGGIVSLITGYFADTTDRSASFNLLVNLFYSSCP